MSVSAALSFVRASVEHECLVTYVSMPWHQQEVDFTVETHPFQNCLTELCTCCCARHCENKTASALDKLTVASAFSN